MASVRVRPWVFITGCVASARGHERGVRALPPIRSPPLHLPPRMCLPTLPGLAGKAQAAPSSPHPSCRFPNSRDRRALRRQPDRSNPRGLQRGPEAALSKCLHRSHPDHRRRSESLWCSTLRRTRSPERSHPYPIAGTTGRPARGPHPCSSEYLVVESQNRSERAAIRLAAEYENVRMSSGTLPVGNISLIPKPARASQLLEGPATRSGAASDSSRRGNRNNVYGLLSLRLNLRR